MRPGGEASGPLAPVASEGHGARAAGRRAGPNGEGWRAGCLPLRSSERDPLFQRPTPVLTHAGILWLCGARVALCGRSGRSVGRHCLGLGTPSSQMGCPQGGGPWGYSPVGKLPSLRCVSKGLGQKGLLRKPSAHGL